MRIDKQASVSSAVASQSRRLAIVMLENAARISPVASPLSPSLSLTALCLAMTSTVNAAAITAVLSNLSLDRHPHVDREYRNIQLRIERREYQRAEEDVRAYMATTQAEIKQSKAAASSSDASSTPSSSLPTVSQLLTTFLPLLRTIGGLRRERSTGVYDPAVLANEVRAYQEAQDARRTRIAVAAATASSSDAATIDDDEIIPRAPHADYVHPMLSLTDIDGRNRGIVVTPSESSSSSSSSPAASFIPAHTTLMCSRALGFVTSSSSTSSSSSSSSSTTPASAAAHEESMATSLVTLLALRMRARPECIKEVYQLDAGERYEEDRERRIARSRSPLDVYRDGALTSVDALAETDPRDLEIDLERLALIVARNAFAPPSDNALSQDDDEEEEGEDENEDDSDEKDGDDKDDSASSIPSIPSTGLWLPSSFLNHSCSPNAHWYCVGDTMFIRSLRAIALDEEVTISYTGFDAQLLSARKKRTEGWGFTCECAEWCEAYKMHPQLEKLEEDFVKSVQDIEPKIHEVVDIIHSTEDESVAHRNGLSALRQLQSQLEKLVLDYQKGLRCACGDAGDSTSDECMRANNDARRNNGIDSSSSSTISLPSVVDVAPAAKSKSKNKKKSSSSASKLSNDPAVGLTTQPYPAHVARLSIHLATPLVLLALCHVSVHDASTSSVESYRASLVKNESLSVASLSCLAEQYGQGDETVVFAWFQLINTQMQFMEGGIEYRPIDQLKAILNMVTQAYITHYGANKEYFMSKWRTLMTKMGLIDLMEE